MEMGMRKTILLLASFALAVVLARGVAWAATIQGTGDPETLIGTPEDDRIVPYGGNDTVYGGRGNDSVAHSFGDDMIKGGPGNDTLRGGRGTDVIYGGPGKDLIDCAWLKNRAGDVEDTAYYIPGEDTVVDCKTKKSWDPTSPQPWDPTSPWDSSDPTDPTYVPPEG
jgi:Ca2+-binding RTX toxin-like protein